MLATVLDLVGDAASRAEGERVLRKAIERCVEADGADSHPYFILHFQLSMTLLKRYKLAESVQAGREALRWCQNRGGEEIDVPRHLWADLEFSTIRAQAILARPLGLLGQAEEAADLACEASDRQMRLAGPNYYSARIHREGGVYLQWMERYDEAEEYLLRSQDASEALWDRPGRAEFYLARGRLLRGVLDAADALPIVERHVASNAGLFAAVTITTQALCLAQLDRFEEAEAVMKRHPGFIDAIAPNHYERRLYFNTRAEIYEGLGEADKAAEYRAMLREAESLPRD
jgi:tetratricopeptide (TPR) repeat protein